MLELSDKEVKESLTKHEQKLTFKFNAFLILSNDIESIVQYNKNKWKNIYGLHEIKPNQEVVQVDDVDDEEGEQND